MAGSTMTSLRSNYDINFLVSKLSDTARLDFDYNIFIKCMRKYFVLISFIDLKKKQKERKKNKSSA